MSVETTFDGLTATAICPDTSCTHTDQAEVGKWHPNEASARHSVALNMSDHYFHRHGIGAQHRARLAGKPFPKSRV